MKKLIIVLSIIFLFVGQSWAYMEGKEAHETYLYPVVRVQTQSAGGSGTVVYSRPANGSEKYVTYILTNHHVIRDAIEICEEWDSVLAKKVQRERRSIVYAEIFKYKDLSTPVGTMRIESDIVIYSKSEDMALIKLRFDEPVKYVAAMPLKDKIKYKVFDSTMVVGCSIGFAPLPTSGMITRLNVQIESYPYHMSSADIVFGNSGGAMFLGKTGELIGIPSRVAVIPIGWGATVITHMGFFIPIERIYAWLESEHYDFIFDPSKNEKDCLEARKTEIEEKQKAARK